MPTHSPFALALCHAGAERWLKAEVARLRPDLHAGFQRPGLVTFKATTTPIRPDTRVDAVFARLWACSAGPAPDDDALRRLLGELGPAVVRVGPREVGSFGDAPPALLDASVEHAKHLTERLRATGIDARDAADARPVRAGQTVVDVITAHGEPSMVAWHTARAGDAPAAGGRWAVPPPQIVASRAWAKLAEALVWSGADLGPSDTVVELGAAPGGGTAVLLERGARVFAVDAQPMDPRLLEHPKLTWFEGAAGALKIEALPSDATWITCDANIPPVDALAAVARLLPSLRRVKGAVITVKLTDDRTVASLPSLLERARALGFSRVRAKHLPGNRKDVAVVATR